MGSMVSQQQRESLRSSKRSANGECFESISIIPCCKNTISPGTHSPNPLISSSGKPRVRLFNTGNKDCESVVGHSSYSIPQKKVKLCKFTYGKEHECRELKTGGHLCTFLRLFDDDIIQDFMWTDCCALLLDKYLIAMVYTYFRRAGLLRKDYTRLNFFIALHLAHDIEEDNEDIKQEIYPWALGRKWESKCVKFLQARDLMWKRMGYRAFVSRLTCEEIFDLCPNHPIWQRTRKGHHGGATRSYPPESDQPFQPRGPDRSPLFCDLCFFSEAAQDKSVNTSGYLSGYSTDSGSE